MWLLAHPYKLIQFPSVESLKLLGFRMWVYRNKGIAPYYINLHPPGTMNNQKNVYRINRF